MTVTNSDGSQTATISTEHTLATITADGSYQLQVNMSNLALGDVLIVREKLKVRSVGTTALIESYRYSHVQASPIKTFIPRPSNLTGRG